MKFRHLLAAVAAIASVLATTVATSACAFFMHQPEEPKCLRDE